MTTAVLGAVYVAAIVLALFLLIGLVPRAPSGPVGGTVGDSRCPYRYRGEDVLRCLRPAGHPGDCLATSIRRENGSPVTGGEDVSGPKELGWS